MSKKLPKENLKKVSGGVTGSKGVVTNAALQGKKIAGGKQFAPEGQVTGGRNIVDKGISGRNISENE